MARLAGAWQQVVARHSSLPSVFIEGLDDETSFNQVVWEACIADLPRVDYQQLKPPHRLTLPELPKSRQPRHCPTRDEPRHH